MAPSLQLVVHSSSRMAVGPLCHAVCSRPSRTCEAGRKESLALTGGRCVAFGERLSLPTVDGRE